MEGYSGKLYNRGVLRRRYNKGRIKFTHQHTVNEVDCGPVSLSLLSRAIKQYAKVIAAVAFREFGERKTYTVIKGAC